MAFGVTSLPVAERTNEQKWGERREEAEGNGGGREEDPKEEEAAVEIFRPRSHTWTL